MITSCDDARKPDSAHCLNWHVSSVLNSDSITFVLSLKHLHSQMSYQYFGEGFRIFVHRDRFSCCLDTPNNCGPLLYLEQLLATPKTFKTKNIYHIYIYITILVYSSRMCFFFYFMLVYLHYIHVPRSNGHRSI